MVPAGAGTYDAYISCTVPSLFGTETDQQLRQIAESCTPATYIEKRAPYLIRNHTYVFYVETARTKFIEARSRLRGNMIHDRYWFFITSRMPENQIQARVRLLAGRLYAARAEKIVTATRRKGFEPYKDLKRTVEFFRKIGEQLIKYGERVFVRCTAADRAAHPEPEKPIDQQRHAAGIVLDACRLFLPLLDPLVRLDLAMVYPGLMGIPSPVAAGG